jgi:hypothetical protein
MTMAHLAMLVLTGPLEQQAHQVEQVRRAPTPLVTSYLELLVLRDSAEKVARAVLVVVVVQERAAFGVTMVPVLPALEVAVAVKAAREALEALEVAALFVSIFYQMELVE